MTDLRTLTDAFAELERRADAAMPATFAPHPPPRRHRLVPVAAALAVAVGLVTGGVLFTPEDGTRTGGPPSGVTTTPFTVPSTPAELATRFRAVLGDTATFDVLDTEVPDELRVAPGPTPMPLVRGPAISGTLTASDVTGGFVLYVYQDDPGASSWCAPGTQLHDCTAITSPPDGSWVSVGKRQSADSPPRITYEVNRLRRDGFRIILHVSNDHDGEVLAQKPPLTTDQLVTIATSGSW